MFPAMLLCKIARCFSRWLHWYELGSHGAGQTQYGILSRTAP
jgi:hypothetical protein